MSVACLAGALLFLSNLFLTSAFLFRCRQWRIAGCIYGCLFLHAHNWDTFGKVKTFSRAALIKEQLPRLIVQLCIIRVPCQLSLADVGTPLRHYIQILWEGIILGRPLTCKVSHRWDILLPPPAASLHLCSHFPFLIFWVHRDSSFLSISMNVSNCFLVVNIVSPLVLLLIPGSNFQTVSPPIGILSERSTLSTNRFSTLGSK